MGKVLVKAIEPNYNTLSGGPQFVIGGGGGDRGRGITMRERAGGTLGGLVGVLGALAGQHRSLGGLAQGMVSGGAQGKALGRALGRKFVGREGQARADIREGRRQQRAQEMAEMAEDQRERGVGSLTAVGPLSRMRRRNAERARQEDQLLDRTRLANRSMDEARRQVGVYNAGRVADARNQMEREAMARRTARARAEGTQFGEQNRKDAEAMRNMRDAYGSVFDSETENMFNQTARRSGGTVRVVPEAEFEEETHAHDTPIVDATGNAVAVVGQALPSQVRALPPPIGNANQEISADEATGLAQGKKEGVDHRRDGLNLNTALRDVQEEQAEDNEEESLANVQAEQAGQETYGGRSSNVFVTPKPTRQTMLPEN